MRKWIAAVLAGATTLAVAGQAAATNFFESAVPTFSGSPWPQNVHFATAGDVTTITVKDLAVSDSFILGGSDVDTPAYMSATATFSSPFDKVTRTFAGVGAQVELLSFDLQLTSQADNSTLLDIHSAAGTLSLGGTGPEAAGGDIRLRNIDFYSPFVSAVPAATTGYLNFTHLDQFYTASGNPLIPNTGSLGLFFVTAIPEPSTWALMLIGFFGLG